MRIVAGKWRARRLSTAKGDSTRPTTDRVREATFSALTSLLGSDLGAGSVLDAFAGSGAMGLEALSRGASAATFVESDRAALATLRDNIGSLGAGGSARVVPGDCFALARRGAVVGGPFALLLLDAPYRIASAEVRGLIEELDSAKALTPDATIVWEHASSSKVSLPPGFDVVSEKRYGVTAVTVAVREEGES